VDLLAVMRGLHAQHGTRVLTLAAFFVGPESVARATKRLRLAPERIGVGALSRVLKRRERPLLRHVREAERWATLSALAWPVERSWRVTSRFGPRIHPVVGGLVEHRGVDVSMPIGTEVRAAADGRVTRVREGAVNGLWLELDHGAGVRTLYLHLSLVDVKRGQQVKAGDVIARSGDTGRVTGAHLHYQVKFDRDMVDPLGSRASPALVAEPFPLKPEPLTASAGGTKGAGEPAAASLFTVGKP
jgi:murein DD-endopeptidase MepM/ murein hydrolase activator NlpD